MLALSPDLTESARSPTIARDDADAISLDPTMVSLYRVIDQLSVGSLLLLLQHVTGRALLLAGNHPIAHRRDDRQSAVSHDDGLAAAADRLDSEQARTLDALDRCHGNQTRAARMLGIARSTLLKRLDLYNVPRPRKP